MNNKTAHNDYAKVYIEQDILHFIYLPIVNLSLDMAKKLVRLRISVQNNKSYPVLCDLREVIQADKSAMDYLAKEGSELATAVALLVKYPHSAFTADFYLQTSLPAVPTRLFEDPLKAKEFLSNYPKRH